MASTAAAVLGALALPERASAEASSSSVSTFQALTSGLKVLPIREGSGPVPEVGDTVSVHWEGFTAGYRQHRMDNT